MKQLSDLLEAAAADAPPARYDVEDAIAAGRRLRRRRNTGWAIAAVVAVATAIGVPQIVTRGSERPIPPVVTTTTTPAAQPRSFDYPFPGYTAGRFRIEEPATLTLGGTQTVIRPVADSGSVSGYLTVYRPGVDPTWAFDGSKITDSAPVNGRQAIFLDPKLPDGPNTAGLAWQYADDAWAIVWSWFGRLKRADLTQVAKRLPTGPKRAARVSFRSTYVPNGYRLVQVDGPDSGGAVSGMLFGPAASGTRQYSERAMTAVLEDSGGALLIRLTRLPASERSRWPATTPVCPKAEWYCYRSLDDGRYLLQVISGKSGVGKTELLKTLQAITIADPGTPAAWTDATRAVPASAQLPAQ
jgi:hypothetical protein